MMGEGRSLLQISLLELIPSVLSVFGRWLMSSAFTATTSQITVAESVDSQFVRTAGPDQRGITRDAQADSKPHLPKG